MGITRVTATSEGRSGWAEITVSQPTPPPPVVASVTLDAATYTLVERASHRFVATPRDAEGAPIAGIAVDWASSDAAVAAVAADGTVTALSWGTARVTARVGEKVATATVHVTMDFAYDLLYDVQPGDARGPELFRLDVRAPGSTAARVFQSAGTWAASASPDGSRIAFACTSDGPSICAANADGSGVVVLTPGTANEDQPVWSPDGSRIAFRRWPAGGPPGLANRADIWVMNADGTGQVSITAGLPAGGTHQSPTWSPRQADGSYRIAFARLTKPGEYVVGRIQSVRVDGTDARAITAGREYLEDEPAWSPDGRTIAFVRTGGTAFGDLWTVNATGGEERPLMVQDPDAAQASPAWSPDGRFIAFTSKHELSADNRWTFQVYTVRADGTQLTRRTADGSDKEHPAWVRR